MELAQGRVQLRALALAVPNLQLLLHFVGYKYNSGTVLPVRDLATFH